MLEKLQDLIEFPGTPVGMLVAIGVIDGIWRISDSVISFVICAALFVVMVLSVIANFSFYGKFMKYTCLILCAITALFLYAERPFGDDAGSYDTPGQYDSGTNYNNGNVGFTGNNYKDYDRDDDRNSGSSRSCGMCNGSGKCHVCKGKRTFYCESIYCNSGRCNSCKGGLYDHGSYVSECLVCDGDGRCDICDGSGRRACGTCDGSGECNNCR